MQIHPMTAADLDDVHMMANTFAEQRSELSFMISAPWCYPVLARASGRLVATAVATYNGSVGWLGKVFVAPEFRGQGIGTTLTKALLHELERKGCTTFALIATEMARGMYEELGFQPQGSYFAFRGPPAQMPVHPRLRPLARADLQGVSDLDRYVTGEDRVQLLGAITHRGWVLTGEDQETIVGYYIPVCWGGGPAVALNPEDGRVLLDVARAQPGFGQGYWPAFYEQNVTGMNHLKAEGFTEYIRLTRMTRGAGPEWKPEAIWGICSPSWG